MTKNKQLEAVLENLILTFYPRSVIQEANHGMEIPEVDNGTLTQESVKKIKAEFNNYFTARLEEVLPEEKEGQFSLSDTELSGNKFLSNEEMGFNHAIKQIKQNAKRN